MRALGSCRLPRLYMHVQTFLQKLKKKFLAIKGDISLCRHSRKFNSFFSLFEARSKKTYSALNYTLKIISFQIGNTCSVCLHGLNNYSHNIKTASWKGDQAIFLVSHVLRSKCTSKFKIFFYWNSARLHTHTYRHVLFNSIQSISDVPYDVSCFPLVGGKTEGTGSQVFQEDSQARCLR